MRGLVEDNHCEGPRVFVAPHSSPSAWLAAALMYGTRAATSHRPHHAVARAVLRAIVHYTTVRRRMPTTRLHADLHVHPRRRVSALRLHTTFHQLLYPCARMEIEKLRVERDRVAPADLRVVTSSGLRLHDGSLVGVVRGARRIPGSRLPRCVATPSAPARPLPTGAPARLPSWANTARMLVSKGGSQAEAAVVSAHTRSILSPRDTRSIMLKNALRTAGSALRTGVLSRASLAPTPFTLQVRPLSAFHRRARADGPGHEEPLRTWCTVCGCTYTGRSSRLRAETPSIACSTVVGLHEGLR